jgi:hypothetical protein
MKNEAIETLEVMIERAELEHSANLTKYKDRLFIQWRKIFENDSQLMKDLKNAENASLYEANEDGIYSWYRSTSLENYTECKEYLDQFVFDYGLSVNWKDSCLMNYLGDDNIIIQDDTRRDNGVWQGSKLLFDEEIYKDEDGEVNIEKRNALIEEHMEKTGCFPGVFRITQYGDVTLVKTN